MLKKKYRTWIEVDRKAIKRNYKTFRSIINADVKLMAVVKSNAYGHGIVEFSQEMVKLGADWLGVDSVIEAFVLRKEGIKTPMLVLGYTLPDKFKKAIEHDVCITVSSFDMIQAIAEANLSKPVSVHIKVDTGMHRQGFLFKEREKLFKMLREQKSIIAIKGLYTHFAAAKDPDGPDETKQQIKEFNNWILAFHDEKYLPMIHSGATSGTILYPEAHFDMVRVGIGMYGLWSSPEVRIFAEQNNITLYPVLSWKTVVSEIKCLSKGARVGYDFTEELKRDSRVAVCPVGYWHGYTRQLSAKSFVLVHGKRAKVLGRITMDMILIDITNVSDANIGDEVILIGSNGGETVSVDELAHIAGTVNYEIVTCINPRIKRIYRS